MSLATRCTHCGTIFKVVQDQLKVSEGWVRCGRCHEVFNALEGLFDLEREAPPARPPAMPPAAASVVEPTTPVEAPAPAAPVWSEPPMAPEPAHPGVTHFDLDLPPTASQPQPFDGRALTPNSDREANADLALPETSEADALESRYLLPKEDAPLRKKRRRRGPEFADAEFPDDLSDPSEWADAWQSEFDERTDTDEAPLVANPEHRPSSTTADDVASGRRTTGSEVEHTEPSTAPLAAPASPTPGLMTPAPRPAMAVTAPSPLEDDFQPEVALPPPSQRKGKPGTRGRPPQADSPEFIRQAERKAIWRHPVMVGVLAVLSMVLTLSLALQAAHHWRDQLAARQPALAPVLAQWCGLVGCQLQPPMQLQQLQVDSIQLVRTASEGPDSYRLTAIVHNSADIGLKWPLLDLTLTDPNGAVLARRLFNVQDARLVPPVESTPNTRPRGDQRVPHAVPPSSQTTIQWQLRAPDLKLAGYTAELFYP